MTLTEWMERYVSGIRIDASIRHNPLRIRNDGLNNPKNYAYCAGFKHDVSRDLRLTFTTTVTPTPERAFRYIRDRLRVVHNTSEYETWRDMMHGLVRGAENVGRGDMENVYFATRSVYADAKKFLGEEILQEFLATTDSE